MKLTAASVKTLALPSGASDKTYFDDDLGGFGVRLRAGGATRWVVQYDIGGKSRRVTLGTTAMLDPGSARAKAKDLLAAVRLGRDPASERQEARVRAAETFGALLPRYLKHKSGKVRAVSLKEVERHLGKHAKSLHPRPITAIDRRTVASLISALAEKNGPTAAKCVRASLAAYFTWLTREGLLDANPVAFTNVPTTNAVRSRLLSDDELRAIWGALGDDNYGDIVRLLAFTGARRLEIGNLSWDEVDLNAAEIRLPATRCKNNRPHIIPLSAPALAILAQRPRNGRAYIFGRGQIGFQGWSRGKRSLDARVPEIPGWVLHDLRRLVSTIMHDKLGIPPHIVEAVLAHVGHKSGIAGTYNKALYLDERRRALERWAEHVDGILSGKKPATIVKLRKRR